MRPIPEGTVKVYFNVIEIEEGRHELEFNFENELLKHREGVTMRTNMYESWINNVLERKLKVKTEVHLGTEFESTRFVGLDGKQIDPFVPTFDIMKVTDLSAEKKASQTINVDSPRFISTLKRSMEEMFRAMDKDGSGKLNYDEFRDSFRTLSYGLNDNDINLLIALADENEDEKIDWPEFLSIGIDAVRTFYTRNLQKASAGDTKAPDHESLKALYWDEIMKVDKLLSYKFKEVDEMQNGLISLKDFKKIIRETKQLNPKEKNLLIRLQKAEQINYFEFPDMLYNVRYEISMSEMMEYNIDNVAYDLRSEFARYDKNNSKTITIHECQVVLQ